MSTLLEGAVERELDPVTDEVELPKGALLEREIRKHCWIRRWILEQSQS